MLQKNTKVSRLPALEVQALVPRRRCGTRSVAKRRTFRRVVNIPSHPPAQIFGRSSSARPGYKIKQWIQTLPSPKDEVVKVK